jgi:hypothetical protein
MKSVERYDDPILANRLRGWMDVAAPAAAPERLVFRVMDQVERAPRRRWLGTRPFLANVVRYAALTLVITIGVAGGILLTRGLPNVGGPSAPPSPSAPTPSLRSLGGFDTNGRLIAGGQKGVWLATSTEQLVPIDVGTAALGEPLEVGFTPADMAVELDSGTRGAEWVWLVDPDAGLLRYEPGVGEVAAAPGAAGSRVAYGQGRAFVSQQGAIVQVDAGFMTLRGSFDVPDHRASDPLVSVGDTLWVADRAGIERIDVPTGARAARIEVTARSLVVSRGRVWASDGASLSGIDPDSGAVTVSAAVPSGTRTIDVLVTHGDVVWLAARGPEGPLLIGVDPSNGRPSSVTPLTTPAISIAVVGNQVWTLDSGGHVDRFEPGS